VVDNRIWRCEMTDEEWVVVDEVAGDLQGEILRGLLEAQDIRVWLSQEGAGHSAYSLGIGPLGRVQILVPSSSSQRARSVLDDYYAGVFEATEFMPDDAADAGESEDQEEPK